jgi:hypothetical protein
MFIGPGPKFIISINSFEVLHPDQPINSFTTIRPCPKEKLFTARNNNKKKQWIIIW